MIISIFDVAALQSAPAHLSDHLPMWIKLWEDFSETYLKDIEVG